MVEIFANLSVERKEEIKNKIADAILFCYSNKLESEDAVTYIDNMIKLLGKKEQSFAYFITTFIMENLSNE